MYDKIVEAYHGRKMVCLQQKNHTKDFFVGIIEGYDESGLLLYSINDRGLPEEHVYFPMEEIADIASESEYLNKIRLLASFYADAENHPVRLGDENLLERVLLLALQEGTKLDVTFRYGSDRLHVYIRKIEDDYLDMETVSETGKYDGHTRTAKAYLKYLFFPLELTK